MGKKAKDEARDSSYPLADSPTPLTSEVMMNKRKDKAKAALDSTAKTTPPIVNRGRRQP
jgi:hypothetical protein